MIGDFQIALIGIVVAVIIIVFGYNRWQERKHRRSVERAFSEDRPDILFDATNVQSPKPETARREPEIGHLPDIDEEINDIPPRTMAT